MRECEEMARTALITGASSGIGAAVAIALARAGYDVWLTYTHNEAEGRKVAEQCRTAGGAAELSHLDLRSNKSIETLVQQVSQAWGSLDALVNNGGVCPYTDYTDITSDGWDEVMETNARGTFLLTRACLPLLRQSREADRDSSVINLSSIAGQVGAIQTGMHYAASKAAILALTRSFSKVLAPEGIRVNAVTPGPVTSNITDQLSADGRQALESGVPLGRFGTPEEVAWVVQMLASPEAGFITGATYDVNGGVRVDG